VSLSLPASACGLYELEWSFDSTKLVNASGDGAYVWDISMGKLITKIPAYYGLTSVSWSPDATKLAVSEGGGACIIYDTVTGELLHGLNVGSTDVDWYSGNNRLLSVSHYDGTIYIIDSNMYEPFVTLTQHTSTDPNPDSNNGAYLVAWSPNGKKFASAGQQSMLVWDTKTYKVLDTIWVNSTNDFAWSPDSNRIATAHGEEGVRIWDADSGELLDTISYAGAVYAVDWSPDGRYLAYGGAREDINMPEITITAVQDA
jgi:WD40 repeat protein